MHNPLRKLMLICYVLAVMVTAGMARGQNLVISEFMAANNNTLLDEDGEASDWIELHNISGNPVNLEGWHLTDDPQSKTKWRFPSRFIPAGGHLVVFASGKNRAGAGNLHTNFRLDAAGEYLALVQPDEAIASEYRPNFPLQEADISFGILSSSARDLLAGTVPIYLVPSTGADFQDEWMQPAFAINNLWLKGNGFGLGYDTIPAGAGTGVNIARNGTAFQSTTGFGLPAEYAIDGDPGSFTHTDSNDDGSTWWVDLGDVFEVSRIVLRNRENCCGSRFRDLTVNLLGQDGRTIVWSSNLLNPENNLNSPTSITLDLFELNVGPVPARIVQVVRTPDPDLSGSGGQGNADEDNVLSLGEAEVYGVDTVSYANSIRTDLTEVMKNRNSSVLVRVPFVVEKVEQLKKIVLQLLYDDGVTVFLNGQQVASFNSPAVLEWNSAATEKREKSLAFQAVNLDLERFRSTLSSGTNWLAFQGLNSSSADNEFLLDIKLLAEMEGESLQVYFEQPTPGATNSPNWNLGKVADTRFSHNRGIYELPFSLSISTETPGAEIRYTVDGSLPEANKGLVYSGSIPIDRTTVIRAAAYKANYRATDVDTHTYLFLTNVIAQPSRPAGFPSTWAGISADYAMDTRITQASPYQGRMVESLTSLPSLAITTPNDNLFGSTRGIYANPERSGIDWERPISLEWIRPDGSDFFQVDCGLRVQGGYFRQRNVTQKHSLRLLFKNEYGPGKLREDIFHEFGAAREFDTLVLRAGANDGYSWGDAKDTEQFIRDEFGRRTFLGMGQPSARGQFVHLYLNGLYWGVYNLTERPAEDFSATYMGGEPEEWDAVNSGEVKNGSLTAWNSWINQVRGTQTLASYQRMKGLNPDGTRNNAYPIYFDSPNYMDYMLLNIWGGNWDWPNKNFWFGRHQAGLAGGFKFYLWDFENTMGNNRDRSPLNMVSPRADIASSWVGEPHYRMQGFSEYQLEFADRVQKHFFGDGALQARFLVSRYTQLADKVESAIIAETARWGDDSLATPQDLSDWRRERDWLLNTYLPQRTSIVLEQLKVRGLFPAVAAPVIEPFGGSVSAVTPIRLSAAAMEIFYLTNGFDPRLPGGAVHPQAKRFNFPNSNQTNVSPSFLLNGNAMIKARAREGNVWSALAEADFRFASNPATSNELVIAEFCYRPADPSTPEEQTVSQNRDDFEFIELLNVSTNILDLSGVKFTTGILFNCEEGTTLASTERVVVVKNKNAFQARYGTFIRLAGVFEGNLSNDGETITLLGSNGMEVANFTYSDRAPWPPSANRNGYSLVLVRPESRPNPENPINWRASVMPGGSPGSTDVIRFSGNPSGDENGNGQIDFLDYLFGTEMKGGLAASLELVDLNGTLTKSLVLTLPVNLSAEDAILKLEVASEINGPWKSSPDFFTLVREERLSNGISRMTYRLNEPMMAATFVRLTVDRYVQE